MATNNNNNVNTTSSSILAQPMFINTTDLNSILTHKSLILHLQTNLPAIQSSIESPIRQSHQTSPNSSLLLMPSWSTSPNLLPYIGVKLVTYHPQNSSLNLPGVQASYTLFSSITGQSLATMDGTELTLYRTACISALASIYLSRQDSKTLVMIGAGSLAPHLIKAHISARPSIKRVIIWNRTAEKAALLANKLSLEHDVILESCWNLEEAIAIADIISCATNSNEAIVKGALLKEGTHVDLVGSFTHSMKECDDETIRKGRVYIDNKAAAVEAGELVGAVERGVISLDEIVGNLVELVGGKVNGRCSKEEITVFKAVGSAEVDILSAQFVYESAVKKNEADLRLV
ncbi:protein SAR DEFICIENT 4 [Impatiens glandulifera]|uniref:protein SAR DEFICIENT 4 n=1 Tax=Impatiens glandulifera TaxID=253017 RepID=UPI001FB0F406|nr:protein SAR DEFICIENT 4 [Impatiens glandulifera]